MGIPGQNEDALSSEKTARIAPFMPFYFPIHAIHIPYVVGHGQKKSASPGEGA
jgi:hypothetical protein